MNFSDYLSLYWHSWISEASLIIVISIILFANWKRISRMAASHMILAAALIWTAGLVLYSIGFAYEGSGKSLLSFLPRAALASAEMFLSNNELIEVSHYYKEDGLYMVCFSLVHFAAVCLSAIVILNTVGFRIKHYFMMLLESHGARRKGGDTYFFWDINTNGLTMAADIRRNFPEARIIFIRPTSESSVGERLEMSDMVGKGSMTRHMAITRSIDSIKDAVVLYSSDDMATCLRRRNMRRIIAFSSSLSFFFFGKDEKSNLTNASMVYDSDAFSHRENLPVNIYTSNTLGGTSKVLEEHISKGRAAGRKIGWKFIDQSYLAVASIRRRPELHPVHCLPTPAVDGCVDSPFCAMTIGFGATGHELYSFFNEFSSFVTSEGKPTPKNLIVVDKDINTTAGPLCISSPGIFHTDSVRMIEEEAGTVQFWRAIKQYAANINCIGVALGDDDLDVKITMELYRAILQYSETTPKNVKIFLRVYSQDNEPDIMRFAGDYNAHKESTGIEIIPFGSITDIYSCDVVMEQDVLKAARQLNYRIGVLRGLNDGIGEVEAWQRDFDIRRHLDTYKSLPLAIDELTRKVIQLHHSSLFIGSVLALAGVDPADKDMLRRYEELSSGRSLGSTTYPGADSKTQELMDTLARTVYERMVTSHWLMGYRPADMEYIKMEPVESSRQKLTPLVKAWEDAEPEVRLMAYTLVDTGFAIALGGTE